ncbi:ROK family transcriptional regulator [Curtobacterium sp. MCSS17_015]|uniref:ROK family transcriptional regulator n=1 Tax=Curtobacterium sp. MCSS17_015 TaxID=2175666 RepID=UPI0021AD368F|nr:ROK family transcriptional regulator [Curtobacterium sp. MCSS17_015]WIB26007.1 ROK family transcriptional regulator [Curtobacterium sp. MCSS17_015]
MTGRRLGPSSAATRSAVLDMVRSGRTVTRAELAARSGLTPTSITRIVKTLLDEGLVVEVGFLDSTGGKRSSLLELNTTGRFAVGVSLDAGRLTYVVTDLAGAVVGRLVSPGIEQDAPGEDVVRIARELGQLLVQLDIPLESVVGVGVAGAGLDLGAGAERHSLTATEWESFALPEALEPRIGLPVVRDNDAACAALGQYWAGRVPSTQDFATLYMSNGFGLGIMVGGSIARGASSNVGEIGHTIVDIDGPECWCGAHGCLEMLAAPRAVVAAADADLAARLGLSGDAQRFRVDFDRIAQAAAQGDADCHALIQRSARYLAAAALSVVNILDLDRIVLAGPGFAEAGAIYAREIRQQVERFARTRGIHGVLVELADPGLDAAAGGAASLALQHALTPHAVRSGGW